MTHCDFAFLINFGASTALFGSTQCCSRRLTYLKKAPHFTNILSKTKSKSPNTIPVTFSMTPRMTKKTRHHVLSVKEPTMKMFFFYAMAATHHTIHTVYSLMQSLEETGSVLNVRRKVHMIKPRNSPALKEDIGTLMYLQGHYIHKDRYANACGMMPG